MPDRTIENPIINSPYVEPTRHFRSDFNNEIINVIDQGRRGCSYYLPIAAPKKKATASLFDNLVEEKKTESGHVNRIRDLVKTWRDGKWSNITPVSRMLLDHWHSDERTRSLFFCQLEALETLIYIAEVARQPIHGNTWIDKYLRDRAEEAGTELFRIACKMATGSGKTVVMSMLIAWQVLNKRRYPQDNRFTDAFLVVAPGITIRDRLRVLLPSDPSNYYRELDIVPPEYRGDLGTARIAITNFHAFQIRETGDAGGLTKRVLEKNHPGVFKETPDEMVNRVCKDLGKHREIMVINDEAHHCYRKIESKEKVKLTREEAADVKSTSKGCLDVDHRAGGGPSENRREGGL